LEWVTPEAVTIAPGAVEGAVVPVPIKVQLKGAVHPGVEDFAVVRG
jgi:hypothetical protein